MFLHQLDEFLGPPLWKGIENPEDDRREPAWISNASFDIAHGFESREPEKFGKGLSQTDMVDYGFETRNYQRIESGNHSPSLFTLHRLALVFQCEITDFFKAIKNG